MNRGGANSGDYKSLVDAIIFIEILIRFHMIRNLILQIILV